jgi:hypothetical protein
MRIIITENQMRWLILEIGTESSPKDKEEIEDKKNLTDKEKAEKSFNQLSGTEKILVCTLLGEAGGEKKDPYKSMLAVANVLYNRSKANHLNKGTTLKDQSLANKQFSMWDKYNRGGETLEDVYNKFKQHTQMKNAISIIKNEEYKNSDVTKGAMFYYASYVSPYWSKDTATTKWVHTTTIETHIFGNVEKKPKNKKT